MVDGRLVSGVLLEMAGKFVEKIFLVDEQDRRAMVEISLQEAVLAVKRAAIGVSHIELGRGRVFPGPGEGPDAGPGVMGKDEDITFDARVVSLEGHGLIPEPSVILNLVHGAAGQGPEDVLCKWGLPDPGLDVDVFWPIGFHVSDLIQPPPWGSSEDPCLTCFGVCPIISSVLLIEVIGIRDDEEGKEESEEQPPEHP
jgi:hypothetical protein